MLDHYFTYFSPRAKAWFGYVVLIKFRFLANICPDLWGRGGVMVSALGFRSKGRWFGAQFLPSCYFLRQETLLHIVSLHPGVQIGTGDILLGGRGDPAMD